MTNSMKPVKQAPFSGFAGFGGGLGTLSSAASGPTYVDDVFSTFVYDGDGSSSRTITNNIDISGEGGLVWVKQRNEARTHNLCDTARGASEIISSSSGGAEATYTSTISGFTNSGFTIGNDSGVNHSSGEYVSWTFRKAPGFFDVVTWTGNGTQGRQISHSLGSVPGMIFVKRLSGSANWEVWHNSFGVNEYMGLNYNSAKYTSGGPWNGTAPTSTHFTVDSTGGDSDVNYNGDEYVAYLFGHNDASFGTDSDEAIIKCGTFTTDSGGLFNVNLGFEPQWLLGKRTDGSGDWFILDQQREWSNLALERAWPNLNQAPFSNEYEGYFFPHSRGFRCTTAFFGGNQQFIYMAIRRQNKPPEAGTEVFDVGLRSGSSSDAKTNSDIFTDMTFVLRRNSSSEYNGIASRIIGRYSLKTNNTDSENSGWLDTNTPWAYMTGAMVNGSNGASNTGNLIDFSFKRAPGFFDVVVYTGTGSSRTVDHNLTVAPELLIVKNRKNSSQWAVYDATNGASKALTFGNSGTFTYNPYWNSTAPTTTQFTVATDGAVNDNNMIYVAYLFASLPGISKVGSYTGTGSNVNVDCGFTSGARFILIKRTDTTGDWYVFNTASGIASGNDPYMLLNSTAAEVTNTDYIDPLNSGFTVTSSAPNGLNASSGTYIFLAIA